MYPHPDKRETGAQLLERHQNGVQDSRPLLRTLSCDPWISLLLPVLSLPKHSTFLWATPGNKKLSTLQPGVLKGQESFVASTSPFLEGEGTQTTLSCSPGTCSL